MKNELFEISHILSIRAKFGPTLLPSEMISGLLHFKDYLQTAVSRVTHCMLPLESATSLLLV